MLVREIVALTLCFIREILPCVNLKVVFKIKNRLNSKFIFKENIKHKKYQKNTFLTFSLVDAVLPIMFKLNVTLRFVPSNIWSLFTY